jgi:hypothetical protein
LLLFFKKEDLAFADHSASEIKSPRLDDEPRGSHQHQFALAERIGEAAWAAGASGFGVTVITNAAADEEPATVAGATVTE